MNRDRQLTRGGRVARQVRELSAAAIRHQAEAFLAYGGSFDAWTRSKDFTPLDRAAILLRVGDRTLSVAK